MQADAPDSNDGESSSTYLAPRVALAIGGSFLFFLILYGGCITGVVLKEPDICFLLGGGRWIFENNQIPAADPFSWTTHYHNVQYVIEKWLAEVIFYGVVSSFGAVGLLVFDALMLCAAFVVMPLRILWRGGFRGLSLLGMTFLATLTSFSHLAIRPEIFSFLFAGIYLEIMIVVSERTKGVKKVDWKSIMLAALLIYLWCNLHTLFIFGIFLPAFYCGCLLLERLIPSTKTNPLNWTVPIMTIACIGASLLNPWGYGLWTYLPNVFGSFNDTNNEMQPISLKNIGSPVFFPFYLLAIIAIKELAKNWRKPLAPGDLFFRGLIPLGLAGGIKTIRSIPLADLFLVTGTARTASTVAVSGEGFKSEVNEHLDRLINPISWQWPSICLVMAALGALVMTNAVPPEIPQGSAAFSPPFQAIEYIREHPPAGNLLNDPHFGATMIWRLNPTPRVFIDPRYNLYGNALLQDYWTMVLCREGWYEMLNKYKIGWIFLPPNLELSKKLQSDPQWRLLYSDKSGVVIERKGQQTEPIEAK